MSSATEASTTQSSRRVQPGRARVLARREDVSLPKGVFRPRSQYALGFGIN